MLSDNSKFVVRSPRHPSGDADAAIVKVIRTPDRKPTELEGSLADLSRNGIQMQIAAPLDDGEPVTVQLAKLSAGIQFVREAKVQWQRAAEGGQHAVGCLFEEVVEWEVLGELFLHGVLDMNLPEDELVERA